LSRVVKKGLLPRRRENFLPPASFPAAAIFGNGFWPTFQPWAGAEKNGETQIKKHDFVHGQA
jgi:hypothetical protein